MYLLSTQHTRDKLIVFSSTEVTYAAECAVAVAFCNVN